MSNNLSKEPHQNPLRVKISYKGLESEFEGTFDDVWKSVNKFLLEVRRIMSPSVGLVSVSGKNIPDILLSLRDSGFFNKEKSSAETYQKLRKLGKTNMTKGAVSMALKRLTAAGHLARHQKENDFMYVAPWSIENGEVE